MTINPVWPFTKQENKFGYENNPNWTDEPSDTTKHYPCGYWFGGPIVLAQPVQSDGLLYSAGLNIYYQLGFGDVIERLIHTLVPNISRIKKVVVGTHRSLIIDTHDLLWCVGDNSDGALGFVSPGTITDWTQIEGFWKEISTSDNYTHTLAIKTDGTLWVTGINNYGQLGLGDKTSRYTFTQVGSATNWTKVSAGSNISLALNSSGDLYAAGDNYGGTGFAVEKTSFECTLTGVSDIYCGYYFSMALKRGDLWVTGTNNDGQLGMNDTLTRDYWIHSSSDPGNIEFITTGNGDIYAYSGTAFVIDSNGVLYAAGSNKNNLMGVADTSDKLEFIQLISDVRYVSCGQYETLLIKTDNTLWGTGLNTSGLLGFGDKAARIVFTQIGNFQWISMDINRSSHSMGTLWDGTYDWK